VKGIPIFYQYLPHHLAEAKERDKLDKLLLDPGWLKAKLSGTDSAHALAADFGTAGRSACIGVC
jgi:APAF-1 helical domain